MEIKISKKHLEKIGSDTLEALVFRNGATPGDKIKILFEQSSEKWRKENNGADEIIVPEYIPMVICASVLSLSNIFEIEIDSYEKV